MVVAGGEVLPDGEVNVGGGELGAAVGEEDSDAARVGAAGGAPAVG